MSGYHRFVALPLIIASLTIAATTHARQAEEEVGGLPIWLVLLARPLTVESVTPSAGTVHETLPASVAVVLNRAVKPSTITNATVQLHQSGGDGTFNDGNEVTLNPAVSAIGDHITLDLNGLSEDPDLYRLTLIGSGNSPITGAAGIVALDGDGNGRAGGDFVSFFTVIEPPGAAPTLAEVQSTVFTPNCALSGCHAGSNPQEGMNLSDGQTWSNTVNVPSNQMLSLDRIEPGDPNNSYLVRKIEGTGQLARMPRNADPLPQSSIDMVREWIEAGATGGGSGDDPPPPDPIPDPIPDPY